MTNLQKTVSYWHFLLLFTLILNSGVTNAQKPVKLKFKKAAPMPFAVYGMAYCADSIRIYLFGGTNSSHQNTGSVLYYDTRINEWLDLSLGQQIAPYRYGRAKYMKDYQVALLVGGVATHGNEIITIPDLRFYDVIQHEIQILGPNPIGSKLPGIAVWEDHLYFFGGSTSYHPSSDEMEFTTDFYSYNLSTGSVISLPDLPEGKETNGGIVNGALYTFGGFDNKANKMIHKYDIQTGEWKVMGQFDEPASAYALARYKHFFILVGDYTNMDRLLVYDTRNNATSEYRMNFKIRHGAAAIVDDTLHVVGGIDDASNYHVSHQHWELSVKSIIP